MASCSLIGAAGATSNCVASCSTSGRLDPTPWPPAAGPTFALRGATRHHDLLQITASTSFLHLSSTTVLKSTSEFRRMDKPRSHQKRFKGVRAARKSASVNSEADDKIAASKAAALEQALAEINKKYGKNTVFRKRDMSEMATVSTFPSGSLLLDYALGGGYPVGRIVEIFGHESSGKTTLVLHAIAEIQKRGGKAALIDAEHAFDPDYAVRLGVDDEELILCQPDSGEAGLEAMDQLVRCGSVDLVCVDSVSALVPVAELEGSMGTSLVGLQARLMGQAMRKVAGNASRSKCTIIFLNQIRYKIGVYGNPETTSGGNALRFFASQRLQIQQCGKLKAMDPISRKEVDVGIRSRVKVKKSKVSPPHRQAEFDILFSQGISKLGDLLDAAEGVQAVERKGAWYSFNGARLGQGREKVLQLLGEKPELVDELEKLVREKLADLSGRVATSTGSGADLDSKQYVVDDDDEEEDFAPQLELEEDTL